NGFAQAGTSPLISTNWTILSGPASISSTNSLSPVVVVTGDTATATLRLTVKDQLGCVKTDDVTLTVNPLPTCSITGLAPVCPMSSHTYDGPAGMASYAWSISGNGAIAGSSNSPSVNVVTGTACDSSFTLTLTIIASNGCPRTCSQSFAVKDITPPSIQCPAPVTVQCAGAIPGPNTASVTASDTCSMATVTHVADVLSASNCVNRFSIIRTYRATDACGNTNDCSQSITVNDTTPPMIGAPGANAMIECPANPMFTPPTATDNCLPAPMVVEIDDVTTPGCGGTYARTKTWKAVDACGNMSGTVSQTITVQDTTNPSITCAPDTTIDCPATPAFPEPVASDLCGGVTLGHSDENLPGNCASGGKIKYRIKRTWTATDDCGKTATCSQTISVRDTAAPSISCAPNTTIDCPDMPVFPEPVASDVCGGVSLSHSDENLPGNCAMGGKIKFAIKRTWTATDDCGNTATCSQTISVQDMAAPSITCAPNTTIDCPDMHVFPEPVASDLCGGVSLSHSDENLPGNCASGGKIKYAIKRTWTATDDCGNTATCSQTISVQDMAAPSITCAPNTTIDCPDLHVFPEPVANDLC